MQILKVKDMPFLLHWELERMKRLRYSEPVPCAICRKMSKEHWTMTRSFRAKDIAGLPSDVMQPMAPVCRRHIVGPLLR